MKTYLYLVLGSVILCRFGSSKSLEKTESVFETRALNKKITSFINELYDREKYIHNLRTGQWNFIFKRSSDEASKKYKEDRVEMRDQKWSVQPDLGFIQLDDWLKMYFIDTSVIIIII